MRRGGRAAPASRILTLRLSRAGVSFFAVPFALPAAAGGAQQHVRLVRGTVMGDVDKGQGDRL